MVVLAMFSALILMGGGGKLTNKNLKGVGEIHRGKRFLIIPYGVTTMGSSQ
jgi:hypothetical protein